MKKKKRDWGCNMVNFPEIVVLSLTSKCNNKCKYCYAQDWGADLSYTNIKRIINLFSKNGVKAVILTGGEPLLRKEFKEILLQIKRLKMKVFLNTSGDFFFNYSDLIINNVDVMGLPIDFSNKSYRNKNNLKNVLKVLKYLKPLKKKPYVKISTVVTHDNLNDLKSIGYMLKQFDVGAWKLCEFIPKSHGLKNKEELMISSKDFDSATKKILKEFSNLEITIAKRRTRTNAHFIVSNAGIVFIPLHRSVNSKNIILGNIFDKDITKKWQKYISNSNYKKNNSVAYNYDFN